MDVELNTSGFIFFSSIFELHMNFQRFGAFKVPICDHRSPKICPLATCKEMKKWEDIKDNDCALTIKKNFFFTIHSMVNVVHLRITSYPFYNYI